MMEKKTITITKATPLMEELIEKAKKRTQIDNILTSKHSIIVKRNQKEVRRTNRSIKNRPKVKNFLKDLKDKETISRRIANHAPQAPFIERKKMN